MNKADTIELVVKVLSDMQRNFGRLERPISAELRPIGDLDQFDSLSGVEATVELSEKLGFELPGVSVFVDSKGTRALTVSEIAERICTLGVERTGNG